jgi:hypothetical protein
MIYITHKVLCLETRSIAYFISLRATFSVIVDFKCLCAFPKHKITVKEKSSFEQFTGVKPAKKLLDFMELLCA